MQCEELTFTQTDNGQGLALRFNTHKSTSLPLSSLDTLRCVTDVASHRH